jgi:hypothetical protein
MKKGGPSRLSNDRVDQVLDMYAPRRSWQEYEGDSSPLCSVTPLADVGLASGGFNTMPMAGTAQRVRPAAKEADSTWLVRRTEATNVAPGSRGADPVVRPRTAYPLGIASGSMTVPFMRVYPYHKATTGPRPVSPRQLDVSIAELVTRMRETHSRPVALWIMCDADHRGRPQRRRKPELALASNVRMSNRRRTRSGWSRSGTGCCPPIGRRSC